jgi:bifunctional UDP-N-acetylglucosamine pyrophosphorylase/glucosamine-1-phosphate N-acetyltransferase
MTTAILLAGGAGRKFWPFAEVRNKCAFPIANVPIIRRLADQLVAHGCSQLLVVTGTHDGSLRAALGGLEEQMRFIARPAAEGTAAAVVRALEDVDADEFVVAYGDVVTADESVTGLLEAFRERGPLAAGLAAPLAGERPGDWITCGIQGERFTHFEGHGRGGSHRLCGLYVFRRAAVPYLLRNPGLMRHVPVGGMPAPEAEVAESVAEMVDAGEEVLAVATSGFFVDVDKPWHILEANRAVLRDMSERLEGDVIADGCKVSDGAEISGRVVLAPGAQIGNRVVVKGDLWLGRNAEVTNGSIVSGPTVIGTSARVRDYALVGGGSALGRHGLVGHGGEFSGVLLDGSYLYHYCEISGVLGCSVDIGAATVCGTLRFDDGNAPHMVGGRREVPRSGANASYLGDYTRTGVNAILMPGVKVGVYSCVGPGVILYDDVPNRQLVLAKQEIVVREWGPEKYGW